MNSNAAKFFALIAVAIQASFAVDGFVVGASDGTFSNNLYGGYGNITRVDIVNNKPTGKKVLSKIAGRFARISQDGKRVAFIAKNRDIMVMSACDGSGAKKVGAAAKTSQGYLAWANSNTILFADGGYGDDGSKTVRKVSADGGKVSVHATLNSKIWVWGVDKTGSKAVLRTVDQKAGGYKCAGSMGDVYKVPNFSGTVNFKCGTNVVDEEGCGNALSPNAQFLCYFGSTDHAKITVVNWSGGGKKTINTANFYSTSKRNNRTRWSSNSEDWLLTYYNNAKQVLINHKTNTCIKVNTSGTRMPGDFWVGKPPSCGGPVASSMHLGTSGTNTMPGIRVTPKGPSCSIDCGISSSVRSLEIYNVKGEIEQRIPVGTKSIEVTGLANGFYMARLVENGAMQAQSAFIVR